MGGQLARRIFACCLAGCLFTVMSGHSARSASVWTDCVGGCPAEYDPVCSTGSDITYPNACIAKCALGGKETWTRGSCDYDNPFDKCTADTAVVCMADPCVVTSSAYPGAMSAICQSVRCTGAETWNQTSPRPIQPCSAVWIPPGGAPFVRWTNIKWVPAGQCGCLATYDPVCSRDNQTFASACAARCAGADVAARGPCGAGGSVGCECPTVYQPMCGADNTTYENACEAVCAGTLVQYPGPCVDPWARSPLRSLRPPPPPSPNPPPPPPSPSPPPPLPPPPPPPSPSPALPAPNTPPGAPPEEPPDMPSRPLESSVLAPLLPQFLSSPPTGSQYVVSSLQPGFARLPPPPLACGQCPTDFDPVCGMDLRNYPNKCVADCLGIKIKKLGKCSHCTGEACIIGKRNDLCFLAAPTVLQCWYGKFECKPAPDVNFGDLLGKCQQRPALPPPSTPPHRTGRRLMAES